jgi:hypothetical protein
VALDCDAHFPLCAVLSYLVARTYVVGKAPEMILAVLVLALWAAGLPVIMNPSNNIAVARPTTIAPFVINVNLFFFAWLSLAVAIYLVISLGQEWYNKRSNHPNIQSGHIIPVGEDPAKVSRWCGMAVASLVVLGASVVTFQNEQCKDWTIEDKYGNTEMHEEFCRRTTFAMALACVSVIMAVAMTSWLLRQQQSGPALELTIATVQLLLWCFGAFFITFRRGPGWTIGTLYFGTWIAFL